MKVSVFKFDGFGVWLLVINVIYMLEELDFI